MLQNHIIRCLRFIINSIDVGICFNVLFCLFIWWDWVGVVSGHLLLKELLHGLVVLFVAVGLIVLLLELVHANGVVAGTHGFDVLRKLILDEVAVSGAEVSVGWNLFAISRNYLLLWLTTSTDWASILSWYYRYSGNSRDSMVDGISTFDIIII